MLAYADRRMPAACGMTEQDMAVSLELKVIADTAGTLILLGSSMFRAFDEDNTRAFADQALGCRSSIRIDPNMGQRYQIEGRESLAGVRSG